MGETISTLVFRPPPPTYIRPDRFFYIDVPVSTEENYSCYACGAIPTSASDTSNCRSSQDNSARHSGMNESCQRAGAFNEKSPRVYRIPAFFIRRKGADVTLLYSHGNAEDLGMMYNRMKDFARNLGVNILAYDYTGYGLSTAAIESNDDSDSFGNGILQPSEAMCYRNIEAAYDHLRRVRGIPASKIVLYGRSLGSGPSCYLAHKTASEGESVAGLILHSPFLSIYKIVVDVGIPLFGDMFRNEKIAKDIRCPVLVIHGTRDDVVPFWHADQLLQLFLPQYQAQPFWVEGLGHNNIEVYVKTEYIARVTSFLYNYVPSSRNSVFPFHDRLLMQTKINDHKENRVNEYDPPALVPESERYDPLSPQQPSVAQKYRPKGDFFVNSNWMKNGAAIVKEAVDDKRKTDSSRTQILQRAKSSEYLLLSSNQSVSFNHEESHVIEEDDKSVASRYLLSRDRMVIETKESEEEDIEPDRGNTASENSLNGLHISFTTSLPQSAHEVIMGIDDTDFVRATKTLVRTKPLKSSS